MDYDINDVILEVIGYGKSISPRWKIEALAVLQQKYGDYAGHIYDSVEDIFRKIDNEKPDWSVLRNMAEACEWKKKCILEVLPNLNADSVNAILWRFAYSNK